MLNNLIASQGGKRGFWNPRTITLSVAVHAILLAGVVYASTRGPGDEREAREEEVTFVDIQEAPEPTEPDPAEEPPPPPEAPETPPPPRGFQELVPPDVPPPNIPEPDMSAPPVLPEDFSGIGERGGKADGVERTGEGDAEGDSDFAYSVTTLDVQPELRNAAQVQRTLARLYPRLLLDAGIEGQVVMRFVITEEGRVDPETVEVVSATDDDFRDASVRAVETFRFRPGKYQGRNVRVLIQMPIAWRART